MTLRAREDLLLPFNHSLWLGDGDHGLNWYADTEEGWTAPRKRAVEVKVVDDRVLLTLQILAPGPATPLRLRFGLLATPFRPLAKGWRRMRLGCSQRWWSQANYDLYDAIFYGGLMNLTIGQRVWEIWDTLDDADHVSHRDAGITLTPAPPKIQCGLYLRRAADENLPVGQASSLPFRADSQAGSSRHGTKPNAVRLKPNAEALLAVGNLSENRERVKVRMDPSTIDLTGMEVVDIFDGQHCELAGQTVSMDVGGKDFRLVALRRPRHEDSAAQFQKTVIGEQ
ncbi:MAG: hypothetical protein H8E44_43665 [Planctomycetes bacterium]|nr:hypothetical protein [Planctomycetota bacterium]